MLNSYQNLLCAIKWLTEATIWDIILKKVFFIGVFILFGVLPRKTNVHVMKGAKTNAQGVQFFGGTVNASGSCFEESCRGDAGL